MEKIKVSKEVYDAMKYIEENKIKFDDVILDLTIGKGYLFKLLKVFNNLKFEYLAKLFLYGYELEKELYTEDNLPLRFKFKSKEDKQKIFHLNYTNNNVCIISWTDYRKDIHSYIEDLELVLSKLNNGDWTIIY